MKIVPKNKKKITPDQVEVGQCFVHVETDSYYMLVDPNSYVLDEGYFDYRVAAVDLRSGKIMALDGDSKIYERCEIEGVVRAEEDVDE